MERVEYDPEIDPSIREAREAAERERELSARIRIEIERYVADNDLVPRSEAQNAQNAQRSQKISGQIPPPWDTETGAEKADGGKSRRQIAREAKETARRAAQEAKEAVREAKEAAREARREQIAAGAATGRRAARSVVTGSILGTEWMRRMRPYLLVIAAVLVCYIAFNFHQQSLHLRRQRLEREVRELGIEAVGRTAERVRQTRRSAIVERLRAKNIPLEEFPHPVKRIER
jgi:type IV secretory pathway VirB10-like protein